MHITHVRVQDMHAMHVKHEMHVFHSVLVHYMWRIITMSLFQALMYENLYMMKYKEMIWFNGKLIGSCLIGARFEFSLAPFFIYKFIYLFYLVMSVVQTPTVSTCASRSSRATRVSRPTCTAIEPTDLCVPIKPNRSVHPDRTEPICASQPNRTCRTVSKIILSSSSTFEQFSLDHLVLHTQIWNNGFWVWLYTSGVEFVLSMWDILQFSPSQLNSYHFHVIFTLLPKIFTTTLITVLDKCTWYLTEQHWGIVRTIQIMRYYTYLNVKYGYVNNHVH